MLADSAPDISLTGSYWFGDTLLFENLELRLSAARWTCLMGPSGIGKSTILRLLAGLPAGGNFIGVLHADHRPMRARVAYMAQSDLLAPWLDVRDNVVLGARLRGQRPDYDHADELLVRVGLADHANKRPQELSGGMRQRAALARTLMEQCPLVLLDEPFSALDARTRADMQELAFELLGGATVLLATHDPAEAIRLAHSIKILFPDGLVEHAVPSSGPVRRIDDDQTLMAQGHLLARLRADRG